MGLHLFRKRTGWAGDQGGICRRLCKNFERRPVTRVNRVFAHDADLWLVVLAWLEPGSWVLVEEQILRAVNWLQTFPWLTESPFLVRCRLGSVPVLFREFAPWPCQNMTHSGSIFVTWRSMATILHQSRRSCWTCSPKKRKFRSTMSWIDNGFQSYFQSIVCRVLCNILIACLEFVTFCPISQSNCRMKT